MSDALECVHISKSFGSLTVVNDVRLQVASGQLLALLGPSGGGKTTMLRLIAGFEWPDNHKDAVIKVGGRVVASDSVRVPAEKRRVGMVFQEYALFPHLDVAGNIAFGLTGNAKKQRVAEMLALVGLDAFAGRMPYELSGGQQQRVALARALAPQPDILLLDEPFSNLDAALRTQVRAEVRSILKAAGITCIFVTHDQEEALSLADAVAVMLNGRVAQIAEPQQLYRQPVSREIAAFIGEANFLPGEATGDNVLCPIGRLRLETPFEGKVDVLIRPEALKIGEMDSYISASGEILWREFYGHDQRVGVKLSDGTTLIARADAERSFRTGQTVGIHVLGSVMAFPKQN